MSAPLYNRDILRLAASVGDWPRLAVPDASAERRSVVCGSRVTVDTQIDEGGRVTAFGMAVHACALGQAAAAVLAASVVGQGLGGVEAARDGFRAFLKGECDSPGDWPGMNVLAVGQGYPARHPALLLAFDAAVEVLEKAPVR